MTFKSCHFREKKQRTDVVSKPMESSSMVTVIDKRLFDASNKKSCSLRNLISTRLRLFSHITSNNGFIDKTNNFTFWAGRMASKIVWYYTVRLFPVRICKVLSLFGLSRFDSGLETKHQSCHWPVTMDTTKGPSET